jgi:hypothetical protein
MPGKLPASHRAGAKRGRMLARVCRKPCRRSVSLHRIVSRRPHANTAEHLRKLEKGLCAAQQTSAAYLDGATVSKGLVGLHSEVRDQAENEREQNHGDRGNQHALCGAEAVHATHSSSLKINQP